MLLAPASPFACTVKSASITVFVARVDTQPAGGAVLLVLLCVHQLDMDRHPLRRHSEGGCFNQQGRHLQRQVRECKAVEGGGGLCVY